LLPLRARCLQDHSAPFVARRGFRCRTTPRRSGGNVYEYINAGAMARAGINLPDDFGPLRLNLALPGSNFFDARGFSAYAFAGVDGRAIARNIFLDGNTFEASRHVEKEPFVGDLQLGFAMALDGMRLSFTHVFRSKDIARSRNRTSSAQSTSLSRPDRAGSIDAAQVRLWR
jgi:lipid A 3-O-deacylase